MIYPGQVLPQRVLCIFIRLKALRKTYHLNDQMLLDFSFFFFLHTHKNIQRTKLSNMERVLIFLWHIIYGLVKDKGRKAC